MKTIFNKLKWAINNIMDDLQSADEEVQSVIKVKHPKRYTMDEYEKRVNKK